MSILLFSEEVRAASALHKTGRTSVKQLVDENPVEPDVPCTLSVTASQVQSSKASIWYYAPSSCAVNVTVTHEGGGNCVVVGPMCDGNLRNCSSATSTEVVQALGAWKLSGPAKAGPGCPVSRQQPECRPWLSCQMDHSSPDSGTFLALDEAPAGWRQ